MRPALIDLRWRLFARHLAASTRPILVGPWRSEMGFEILYWIPFLHRFRQRYQIQKDRMIAIGRGGSAAWYDCAGTADLYERMPVEEARTLSIQASQHTGSIKQQDSPAWERHVCGLTANGLGIAKYHILSPKWMYQTLRPFWEGTQTLMWLTQRTLQAVKMPPPPIPADLAARLPARYVAMRWYARPTWPLKEDLVLWTRQLVEATASRIPVVIIGAGLHADDHADTHIGRLTNVLRLTDLIQQTPLNNLAIQSAVVARAQAYVGTYGGMAQGAMRWGVPTVALYDAFGQTSQAHLQLTQYLSLQTGTPFVMTQPRALDTLIPILLNSGAQMASRHQPEPHGSSGVMEAVPG